MNKVNIIGRLTRDPDVKYTTGEKALAIAKYTLAVERKYKKQGENTADFINCVAFGKSAEFAAKYLHQGVKIAVSGHIQTGNYTNKDGVKIHTTDVVADEQEFCESKVINDPPIVEKNKDDEFRMSAPDDFINIPDNIDEELPFV